jgi:phosphoglycerol transferase MdoB-like AlkP superfamily enzyme
VSTTGRLFSSGLAFSFLFSVSLSIMFFIICTLFTGKARNISAALLLGLSAFIFSSQMIYYKFFKTFYTLYSAKNASQIFEFWRDILTLTVRNLTLILSFFLPSVLIIALGRKIISFENINHLYRAVLVCCIVLVHSAALIAVDISGREQYSPYDLYFKTNYPILSVERLGLITTIRLDLQRLATGWSPAPEDMTSQAIPDSGANESGKIKYTESKYNAMDIDFSSLISLEKDEVIRNMHKYFSSVPPASKNSYTGKYKGYNLIFITAESFSPYAVRKDLTPTLYKMVHEGFNFTNFYNPIWGVSTSDGEYVACTGLIPKSGVWSFYKSGSIYMPFTMGNQFKKLGYRTTAYHNHVYSYYRRDVSHPNMGYDYIAVGKGLNVRKTWPESDIEMMQRTVPQYINKQPFHTYYMTVSGHMLYSFSRNFIAYKNKAYVKNLPYPESCRAYISCQIELDRALQYLLNELDKAGIGDKTLIALSPDHYPYALNDREISILAGHKVEKNFELYKSTFILYARGMKPVTIDRPCSSLDIIPTLSNLFGLQYDSRLLMGTDIFSDSKPLVIFQNKSFITDKGRYNSETGKFILNKGVSAGKDYRRKISGIINNKFYHSAKILETDYYGKIFGF